MAFKCIECEIETTTNWLRICRSCESHKKEVIICANCALDKHRTHFLDKFYSQKATKIVKTKQNWKKQFQKFFYRSSEGYQRLFFKQKQQPLSSKPMHMLPPMFNQPCCIKSKNRNISFQSYVNIKNSNLDVPSGIIYTSVY